MRLAAPAPSQHSRYMCCSVFCVSTFVFGISLCFAHSISLPPSVVPPYLSSSCLCISIFSSRCVCACLLCGSVCLIVRKRERVHKFKGTPGINVSSLSLSLSLSLSHFLSLSCLLSLKSESSIEHCVVRALRKYMRSH